MISAEPITLPEAQRALQAARAVLAHPRVPATNKAVKRMWEYFDWFENLVYNTPFEVGTRRQNRAMRKALQVLVPKVARECAVLLAQNYPAVARKRVVGKLPARTFQVVYWRRFGKQLDTLAQINAGPVHQFETETQALPAGEDLPPFPLLGSVTPTVDTTAARLRAAWEQASVLPTLTTEDRFLLTQIASVYLPDSWRLYAEAQRLHTDVRSQAAEMLLTQLHALQNEVEVLLDRGGEDVLTRLGAQTRFIQQKSQPPQPTELDLCSDINPKEAPGGETV